MPWEGCGMAFSDQVNRLLKNLEYRLSLVGMVVAAVGSFALPAWAVRATEAFAEYSPASWVAAGFAGLILAALSYAIYALAYNRVIRSRYNQNLYKRTGFVDPMAVTFENKRIFLADFVLPSDSYIHGKTFINCEIVGPANLFLKGNYQVHEQRLPYVDAVVLNGDRTFYNGIIVENCTFRACSFRRITLMMLPAEYEMYRQLDWLNWISRPGEAQASLPDMGPAATAEPNQPRLPPSTVEETQQ